ncbi:MAG: tetratricopeptide repeat protein [Campylobacterales bacterium]|nr:tetratricopeptide repeat protein [Campylobacterales bacterium]
MIKTIISIGLLLSVNLFADLVDDGSAEYDKGNKKEAIGLYTQACDGGNMHACIKLGLQYASGDGVKQDTRKAKKLFVEACKARYSKGCFGLGVLYKQGSDGVKQDIRKAQMAFSRACYIGDQRGCEQFNLLDSNMSYTL